MNLSELNKILGDRLGRNPKGEPYYKWINSNDFFHLMRKLDDFEEARSESGLLVLIQPKYVERKMCPDLDNIWMIAHWHPGMSKWEWETKYGGDLLWPRDGYYAPTNIVLGPGEQPSHSTTEQVVYLVKKQAQKTFADHLRDSERIVERRDKHLVDQISDQIDEDTTAFANVPGTRSGHVSLPAVGANK